MELISIIDLYGIQLMKCFKYITGKEGEERGQIYDDQKKLILTLFDTKESCVDSEDFIKWLRHLIMNDYNDYVIFDENYGQYISDYNIRYLNSVPNRDITLENERFFILPYVLYIVTMSFKRENITVVIITLPEKVIMYNVKEGCSILHKKEFDLYNFQFLWNTFISSTTVNDNTEYNKLLDDVFNTLFGIKIEGSKRFKEFLFFYRCFNIKKVQKIMVSRILDDLSSYRKVFDLRTNSDRKIYNEMFTNINEYYKTYLLPLYKRLYNEYKHKGLTDFVMSHVL